jgi:soluble lytic murein transglycosylase-like protein
MLSRVPAPLLPWRSALLGLVGAVLLTGPSARADIYRTVGEDGVISFTSDPKPKSKRVVKEAEAHLPQDRDPVRFGRYDEFIREAASLYQIPEPLIRAVILVESNYDPRAVSPVGAVGLMQLMPGTARTMMVEDIYDPRQNILGGTRYLRILANMFGGDIFLTVAAYNAGENAVLRYGGIPPYSETQHYVVKVVENYQRFREQAPKPAAR